VACPAARHGRSPWRRAPALALALLVGCAGPARQEDGRYEVRAKGYRVTPPPGWTRIDTDADLAFRRVSPPAGLMAHGTCAAPISGRPLGVLARHQRFGLRDVRDLEETPVTVDGLAGTLTRFTATLDGVPVAARTLIVKGARCVYDLAVVAPPDGLDAVLPDFARFTATFAVSEAVR
jgi:hypothetical protein